MLYIYQIIHFTMRNGYCKIIANSHNDIEHQLFTASVVLLFSDLKYFHILCELHIWSFLAFREQLWILLLLSFRSSLSDWPFLYWRKLENEKRLQGVPYYSARPFVLITRWWTNNASIYCWINTENQPCTQGGGGLRGQTTSPLLV